MNTPVFGLAVVFCILHEFLLGNWIFQFSNNTTDQQSLYIDLGYFWSAFKRAMSLDRDRYFVDTDLL